MKLFRSTILKPTSKYKVELIRDGLLVVNNGRIEYCGNYSNDIARSNQLNLTCLPLIIPTFADVHLHLPQLDCINKGSLRLMDWLSTFIYPAEAAFSDPNTAREVSSRFFRELTKNGTTMAGVLLTVHEEASRIAFEEAARSRLRILMGKAMMDQNCPKSLCEGTDTSVEAAIRLCKDWNGKCDGRIRYAFYPRFALTCSTKLWEEVGRLAASHGAYIHTHMAETVEECQTFQNMYGMKDYFSLLENTACACERTIIAHALYLSQGEFERIAKHKVKIAHCPSSNIFLKSGRFPIEKVRKAGCDFALATDVGAGTSISMFDAMRKMIASQEDGVVSYEEAFWRATAAGADVLGWKGYNRLEKNTPADFLVINPTNAGVDVNKMNGREIISKLITNGGPHCIAAVYIAGTPAA